VKQHGHVHFWRQRDERLTDRGPSRCIIAETIIKDTKASVFWNLVVGRHSTINRQQGNPNLTDSKHKTSYGGRLLEELDGWVATGQNRLKGETFQCRVVIAVTAVRFVSASQSFGEKNFPIRSC
jgi:hypothetical protein